MRALESPNRIVSDFVPHKQDFEFLERERERESSSFKIHERCLYKKKPKSRERER